jgi:hypothetical protein
MALGLVVASLGIDQKAQNEAIAKHLSFGYPLHFAASDFTSYYAPITRRRPIPRRTN